MHIAALRQYLLASCLSLGLLQSAMAAAPAAEVQAVQYPAWLDRNGKLTPLSPADGVRSSDTVVSGSGSRVMLGLADGSQIKLGSEGRFAIEQLSIQNFKLIKGFFRYSSSALGKLSGKRNIDLKVSTATIGVRGTDYWAMTDAAHDAVCVFDGKVEVATQDQGVINLDQPTAFWARFFDKPSQPAGNATPAELARFIASVEPVPGNGVAIVNGRWRIVAAAETTATAAQAINKSLREQGYPAEVARNHGLNEVRINYFASRTDAEATLKRLTAQEGLTGRDAKVVAAR
jgi:hypothetical protein